MLTLITGLLPDIWPYLAGAVALFAGLWRWGAKKKAQGRDKVLRELMQDNHKRVERGRDAVADIRGADRDQLDKRLRDNDGQW